MAPPFTLRTLGVPQLLTATGEAVRFRTRKHFALAIRLAIEPGRPLTRDHLLELFWGDAPEQRGRHSLAQAITVLKSRLGSSSVLIHKSTVALAPEIVDADVTHLDSCDTTIGGRFLEGFEIPRARAFEDWRDAWNAKLLPKLRDCLVRQMDAGRRVGDFETVERHARVLGELEPLSEDALRGIMEARAWVGDRTSALKAFSEFERRLASDLKARPSPELVRIANLLREGRRSPYRQPSEPAVETGEKRFEPERLIGREKEFGQMYDAWVGVRRREPSVVVVTGDPGIGKTTLTNAFVSTCQMEGAIVARAQAYDAERELPFAVLAELVRQLTIQRAIGAAEPEALSELSRVCPEVLTIFPGVPKPIEWSADITPLRLADALLKTVSAASQDSPIVLVVDDVHAIDNASAGILHVLARKVRTIPLLLMLTARMSELRAVSGASTLATDSAISGFRTVSLEPLSTQAASDLVRCCEVEREFAVDDRITARILAAANGNPLAIELLVREWQSHGTGSLLNDIERLNTLPAATLGIPRAIQTVFDRLVRRLDRRLRGALDLAAVLGRRCSTLAIYNVVGIPQSEAAESLSRLRDEGMLREVHGELEFRNELLRAQAYYAMSPPERQHLHERVAIHLTELTETAGDSRELEIAWHFLRAGEHQRSLPFVMRGCAQAVDAGAPSEAQKLLQALGSVAGGVSKLDPRARLLLARAHMAQSNAEDALPIIEELLRGDLPPEDMALTAGMAATVEHLLNRDLGVRYGAAADRALRLAAISDRPDLMARALFESARAGAESGDEQRISDARRGLEDLIRDPRANELAIAHYARGFCEYYSYNPRAAMEALERAVALLPSSPDPSELSRVLTGLAVCTIDLCQLEVAANCLKRAMTLAERVSDDTRASIISANMCMLELIQGRFDHAVELGLRSLQFARSAVTQPVLSQAYLNLCEAYLMLGEQERADECQESARKWLLGRRNWKANVEFLCQAAYGALLRGNTQEALDIIEKIEHLSKGRKRAIAPPVGIDLLELFRLAHVGDSEAALSEAQAMRSCHRDRHPLLFLDAAAAVAWLETKLHGAPSPETERDLLLFDAWGITGRKQQLIQEGFLSEAISPVRNDRTSRLPANRTRSRSTPTKA